MNDKNKKLKIKGTWDWDTIEEETMIENSEWLQILLRPFQETSSFITVFSNIMGLFVFLFYLFPFDILNGNSMVIKVHILKTKIG